MMLVRLRVISPLKKFDTHMWHRLPAGENGINAGATLLQRIARERAKFDGWCAGILCEARGARVLGVIDSDRNFLDG